MRLFRLWSCCLALSVYLLANGAAAAASRTHVYLLRGIFGVSVGLDALAIKLGQLGIPASVHAHGDGSSIAAQAARDYKSGRIRSIILIGHSLGAGAVIGVARDLKEAGVPVTLLIALDPISSASVPPNVRQAVDFYESGWGVPVGKDPGFHGVFRNVDVSGDPGMGHMAIQSSDKMHARIISAVRAAVGAGSATASRPGPKPGQEPGQEPGQGVAAAKPDGA